MDLESWVVNLLDAIKTAAEKGENYHLLLESDVVAYIAHAYEQTKWIEIY